MGNTQIHEKLESEGFEVSRATINIELAKLRRKAKEVFIRQEYELGDRLEYDFGEVQLDLYFLTRKRPIFAKILIQKSPTSIA